MGSTSPEKLIAMFLINDFSIEGGSLALGVRGFVVVAGFVAGCAFARLLGILLFVTGAFRGVAWIHAGLLLFTCSRVLFWLISLALLATVRGGTSFLFPTAKKKQKQRKRLFNR